MTTPAYPTSSETWEGLEQAAPRRWGVASFCSFLHPLGFCWFPFGLSQVGRLWLLGSLIVVCVARGATFPRELRGPLAAGLAGAFVLGVALVAHVGETEFLTDVVRLGLATGYFFLCLFAFRGAARLAPLGLGLAAAAGVFLAASLPQFIEAARGGASEGTATLYEQKELLSSVTGFHINPNLPLLLCVIWFGLAAALPGRAAMWTAALLSIGVAWLTGVRATFFGAALASAVLVSVWLVPAARRAWRIGLGVALLLPCAAAAAVSAGLVQDPWLSEADQWLSGRLTLWTAAWDSFLHHVGWGAGPESWPTQLAIHLPTAHPWREESSLALVSGGFHNALLQLLAERGLFVGLLYLGTVAAVLEFATALFARWRRHPAAGEAVPYAFLALLFIFRSLFEISGFLGFYKGPVDYFCTLLFAVVIVKGLQPWDENAWSTSPRSFPSDATASS